MRRRSFERLNEAAQAGRATGGRSAAAVRPDDRRPGRTAFDADDIPDLTPIAGVVLVGLAVLIALAIGGLVAAAWETVLLWQQPRPVLADRAAVVDPIFGRDIGFFLFELPFLRLIQSLFNGIVVASAAPGRRRAISSAASRGSLVFTTPVRVHLGVLGGLFLLSVAFGYQLDKYELVVQHPRHRDAACQLHRPERPVLRLRRPDRAVRPRGGVPRRRRRSPGWCGRWR